MNDLEILIETLERDLEILDRFPVILSTHPARSIHDEKRKEIDTLKEVIEIFEKYKAYLTEGGLI